MKAEQTTVLTKTEFGLYDLQIMDKDNVTICEVKSIPRAKAISLIEKYTEPERA